jgi:hypothetical protein
VQGSKTTDIKKNTSETGIGKANAFTTAATRTITAGMRTKTMPIAGISRGITKNIVLLLKRAAGSNGPIGIGGTVIRTAITTAASR